MEASTAEREEQEGTAGNVGRIEEIQGVVIEAVFTDELPEINNAITIERPGDGRHARLRGAAAPRRRPRPRGRPRRDRRPRARDGGRRHRRPDHRAGRQRHPRPDLQRPRRRDRRGRADRGRGALADPPRRPDGRGPHPDDGDVRDRHQGRRPARALRQGRQGRPVRRRRRRQDGDHPGADPQPRQGARRPVGVLRRGRALPRGQRPLARDDRVGRDRQDHARASAR